MFFSLRGELFDKQLKSNENAQLDTWQLSCHVGESAKHPINPAPENDKKVVAEVLVAAAYNAWDVDDRARMRHGSCVRRAYPGNVLSIWRPFVEANNHYISSKLSKFLPQQSNQRAVDPIIVFSIAPQRLSPCGSFSRESFIGLTCWYLLSGVSYIG
jgi:hypothetical protein